METGLKVKVKAFPETPGVYLIKDAGGRLLYVGKAINLRKRASSYFLAGRDPKTRALMERARVMEYVECLNEAQALFLEASLIKERKPPYNIELRDDKSYPYLQITSQAYPRIFVGRPKLKFAGKPIGPYTSAFALKSALAAARKVFGFRTCRVMPKKACLYYHLKLCPGPCENRIDPQDYAAQVSAVARIFKGERRQLMQELTEQMNGFAAKNNFEAAAFIRDKLVDLELLYEGKARPHELTALRDALKLTRTPLVVEAIDISSTGGLQATGSVVVFRAGNPDRSSYRRFRIKTVPSADDFGRIGEVVRRRYSRLSAEQQSLPDLVLVDGGLGQVNRAKRELDSLGLDIPVIGLAKENEEIWLAATTQPLVLPKNSPALQVLQRLRDEAHRFARKYHLLLRGKKALE